jgi:carboxypeptidase Taq
MVAQPMPALDTLRRRLAEVQDLHAIGMGLEWDQQVMMPPRGASLRAEALATLETLHHERFASEETGRLLEAAQREVDGAGEIDGDLLRVTRRDWEKARRVPTDLKAELARAGATGYAAWTRARAASDWELFRPHLERMLELKARYVECFDGFACAYDVLLDDFEQGTTSAEVAAVFDEVKAGLVPLIADIGHADRVDDACLHGDFPVERQEALLHRLLPVFGFDAEAWRLDVTVHPFATNLGTSDIRITTRYDPAFFNVAFFGALHETGHGLYEAGSDPALDRTPLVGGASLGLHESQSRLWENVVGRGRPFSAWVLPMLREAFPDRFGAVDVDTYYRAVNRVEPSLIRVEADEATYSLHVILRFELEQEMIEGRLALRDLPEAWNARMREYLGVEVPDDARGVLQDVHWSAGLIGYFPTYALGNIMAAQIWEIVRGERPTLDAEIGHGDLAPLRDWLAARLYRHGRRRTPKETLANVLGGGALDAGPYLAYLRGKLGAIYGLDARPARS